MTRADLTHHAEVRAAQRAITSIDIDLLLMIGTPVDDGFLATDKGCADVERRCRLMIDRIRRLRGKRIIMGGNRVITAYRATKRQKRRLIRSAYESEIE